jgi:argininosuccinate lyase
MLAAAPMGFSLATEIADFLVRAHIPFSQAHEAAGRCVAQCEKLGIALHELSDDQLIAIHTALTPDVRKVLTVDGALASRTTRGGTSPSSLEVQLKDLKVELSQNTTKFTAESKAFSGMMGA